MCFSSSVFQDNAAVRNGHGSLPVSTTMEDAYDPILPNDISKHCLALVPRSDLPKIGAVCKRWRSFIRSKVLIIVRKLAGVLEERLYVLTLDEEGKSSRWEVFDSFGIEPTPAKWGFSVMALDGRLVVLGGYTVSDRTVSVSTDGYQYASFLNSWSKMAEMNWARYDFACAVVNGKIYVAGGCGADGESLSSMEVYDPDTCEWTIVESLRRPRRGCFACGVEGKLYVMGGRSSFTIGNSRFVHIYSPRGRSWSQTKNGCVMVTARTVLGTKLCCLEKLYTL